MIAAGEVVLRPASVVKELVENAVDAGADDIKVFITDAGRTLIQVIDNGCGMSRADAALCFERHATSKIAQASDLEGGIRSFGFRGEALASVAAVAEVTLRTRRAEDDTATEVRVSGGSDMAVSETSAPAGSNFAVRNLFFNTPARRKFLKSDTVEFRHIVDEFNRVALTRPEVSFSLVHNGKDVVVARKTSGLKFRILDILGGGVADDLVDIGTESSVVGINGFVGRPDTARKTVGNQFLFVNGRYFRSAYLHKAVMSAYEDMLPAGLTPSYFLFLTVDPAAMDVNVHPAKTEIKFEEDSAIYQVLYATVRETLGRNCFGASIDFDTEGSVPLPQLGSSFNEFKPTSFEPSPSVDDSYNPFEKSSFDSPSAGRTVGSVRQDYSALFEPVKTEAPADLFVLQGKYICTKTASGLMVVNVRRAMQRIQYERALAALEGGERVSQTTLFPVQVQTGISQRLVFEENEALLRSLGFDITSFGSDTIVVNAVPEGYGVSETAVRQTVSDLLPILCEDRGAQLSSVIRSSLAEKMSVLGSTNFSFDANPASARQLLDTLYACGNSELTPSGKRIASLLTFDEIEKRF